MAVMLVIDCRNVGIKQLIIGGEMAHWKTPVRDEGKVILLPCMSGSADTAHGWSQREDAAR